MGHSHPDGAHTHGSSSSAGVLDSAAQLVAIIALAVAGIDVVMWLLHIVVIIATGIGFAVLAAGAGYGSHKWRQLRQRRYQAWAQLYPPRPAGRISPYQQMQPPALSPGGDIHLHLPQGMPPEAVAQIMRGQQRALPGPYGYERGDGW